VTDRATFAYLCDVYILESHRGRGLAQQLLRALFRHPDLQGLRRTPLATRDAHRFYVRLGFTPLGAPERMMEIHNPAVYRGVAQ
jgi:GNAT superfamily N-acetyltransferase